ncbi:type I methionyl aminopeptidase [Actinomyces sp. zg-332]|uniref:type I methionyl aminopeptidase n=1 Tax=Actinomyces sp. zg-332 TaxID=2708340 RepID=UPI0014212D30|nr:type I methionyl aminopeptidase [Actinomyces sp. zg-332]QPK93642.1 type I methionyl aminopeptidase [Actinomyces sp. zg-332]
MSHPNRTISKGTVSDTLTVPGHIQRPEYLFHDGPENVTTSDVKSPETIELIRNAGRIAAQALVEVGKVAKPGVTTDSLDKLAHEFILDHNAYPSCLGYMGFPKSICTSVNEVICHGIPDSYVLQDGDILNVDITAYKDGVHGDTCTMFEIGEVDEQSHLLIERTHEAMMRGIKAAKPGRSVNIIGRVIEVYANRFNYGIVRDYTGHGVGEAFHSGLIIPHYDSPLHDTIIEPGMVFTVEPMLTLGTHEWDLWEDDWTVVTKDKSWCAQFEHTIAVTENGFDILTLP